MHETFDLLPRLVFFLIVLIVLIVLALVARTVRATMLASTSVWHVQPVLFSALARDR